MVLISIAAIVTLYLGSFMKITVKLSINEETAQKLAGDSADLSAMGDFEFTLPLSIEIKDKDLIFSVTPEGAKKSTSELIAREVSGILDTLLTAADDLLKHVTNVIVNTVVVKAEEAIANAVDGEEFENAKQKLNDDYDISDADINGLKNDLSDALVAFMNGDDDTVAATMRESETLEKLIAIYAEQDLKSSTGSETVTQEQIDAKTEQLKEELITKYEDTIKEYENENGRITKDSIVIAAVGGMVGDGEDGQKVETIDDVKAVISDKVNGAIEENGEMITYVMMGMGIFVVIVMAAWAYLILKIIVKSFMRNKTVGMFFPRFFGWMPHVIFVGLPMLAVKLSGFAIKQLTQHGMEDMANTIGSALSMINVNITSLTWVSALCTVALFIIWIPYYQWRRKLKKEVKAAKAGR